MIRLHICRKSELQNSIGPSEVCDQSIDLAKRMCCGIESVIGRRVQSNEGASVGASAIWLTDQSAMFSIPKERS